MTFDQLRILANEGIRALKQRSALNPLLWLCAIVSTPLLWVSANSQMMWMSISLLVIGCVPIATAIYAYLYFMFTEPALLRSEEYQLRSRVFDLIETKSGKITVDPTKLELILNPYDVPLLPSDKEADKEGGHA